MATIRSVCPESDTPCACWPKAAANEPSPNRPAPRATPSSYYEAFRASRLSFPELDKLSDKDLEDLLIKPPEAPANDRVATLIGIFPGIEKALKRKGVTCQELWKQYAADTPVPWS